MNEVGGKWKQAKKQECKWGQKNLFVAKLVIFHD